MSPSTLLISVEFIPNAATCGRTRRKYAWTTLLAESLSSAVLIRCALEALMDKRNVSNRDQRESQGSFTGADMFSGWFVG